MTLHNLQRFFIPLGLVVAFGAIYWLSERAIGGLESEHPGNEASVLNASSLLFQFRTVAFFFFGAVCLISGAMCRDVGKWFGIVKETPEPTLKENSQIPAMLSREAFVLVDSSHQVISVNRAFEAEFGIEIGQIRGKPIRKVFKNLEELIDGFTYSARLAKLAGDETCEIVLTKPDRKVFRASVEATDAGKVWYFSEITAYRELEAEVRQSQKMAAVGRLAMGIAHDFNNLLTGINGNLAIMEMELDTRKLDIPERSNLRFAIKAGLRAGELVKQMLCFARTESGTADSFRAEEVVEEVKGILNASINPSISFQTFCPADLWRAQGDSNMLSQILVNLSTNARDALIDGGTISIRLNNQTVTPADLENSKEGVAGEFVRISVIDDGTGISPELREKIFTPFFTTKVVGEGTGLGLSTSMKLIRKMGGWISMESELGVGTRFDVHLPKGEPTSDSRNALVEVSLVAKSCGENSRETILIVDDDEGVQMVAVTILKRMGYSVLIASNGKEALQVYEERGDEIDLVILDLTMPVLSGEETLVRLRNGYPHVPVVICSGYLLDLDEFEKKNGHRPDGVVQKPYRIDAMVSCIRQLLDLNSVALAG